MYQLIIRPSILRRIIVQPLTVLVAIVLLVAVPSAAYSQDTDLKDELTEKLAEAERLLEENKASHEDTAEKKRVIDEELAAREAREAEIEEELATLCAEQDKLSPGSLDECIAQLKN